MSDKFAGQTGPCPSCKKPITIPKLEEQVVIHAPDDALGPKDAKGRPVLKTERASDAKFSPLLAGAVGLVTVVLFGGALFLRGSEVSGNATILGAGALLLGPLVAWSGYSFLRDQELQPHAGGALAVRCLGCGVGFAAGWLAFWVIAAQLGGSWTLGEMNALQLVFVTAVGVGIAAFAAFVSLDLDPANALIHAAMYFGIAVLLRLAMGLTSLPGLAGG